MLYAAVWYNGWVEPPGYFVLNINLKGDNPQEVLRDNLPQLTQLARETFFLDEWSDNKIQETLYIFPSNSLTSVHSISAT